MLGWFLLWLILLLWSLIVFFILAPHLLNNGANDANIENCDLVYMPSDQGAKICKHRISCKLPRTRHMID